LRPPAEKVKKKRKGKGTFLKSGGPVKRVLENSQILTHAQSEDTKRKKKKKKRYTTANDSYRERQKNHGGEIVSVVTPSFGEREGRGEVKSRSALLSGILR